MCVYVYKWYHAISTTLNYPRPSHLYLCLTYHVQVRWQWPPRKRPPKNSTVTQVGDPVLTEMLSQDLKSMLEISLPLSPACETNARKLIVSQPHKTNNHLPYHESFYYLVLWNWLKSNFVCKSFLLESCVNLYSTFKAQLDE